MEKKNILKWVTLTFIFIIVLFLFLKITIYIMKPSSVDLNNIAGFYGEKEKSLDMVYIGGSAAFVYWEPLRAYEKEGIASYNYAANTIQPELYKMMIKEILERQEPEVILIDARAFQYREKDQPPTEVAYRNVLTGMPLSINKIEFIHNNVNKYLNQDTTSYYFDIIKYHRDTKKQNIHSQIKMAFNCYENPYKGFEFIPKVCKLDMVERESEIKTPIDKETEKILIDLLEFMNTTNCKYLFIVSPYQEQKEHKENFNYVADIVESYGYNFLNSNDFYKEMNLDFDKDLYNNNHVNILGADKYTDFLSEYLLENYNLPNRKEDSNYKEWNKLLEEWNNRVNETKNKINKLIKESK